MDDDLVHTTSTISSVRVLSRTRSSRNPATSNRDYIYTPSGVKVSRALMNPRGNFRGNDVIILA